MRAKEAGDDSDVTANACSGGPGGAGGRGGPAAGGHGGVSALIAFSGGSVERTGGAADDQVGAPGSGGAGNNNDGTAAPAPNGPTGLQCGELELPAENCD